MKKIYVMGDTQNEKVLCKEFKIYFENKLTSKVGLYVVMESFFLHYVHEYCFPINILVYIVLNIYILSCLIVVM